MGLKDCCFYLLSLTTQTALLENYQSKDFHKCEEGKGEVEKDNAIHG